MSIDRHASPPAWGPLYRPPCCWDGKTPYLLQLGVTTVGGVCVRLYRLSDGRVIANLNDLAEAAMWVRMWE